MKLLFTFLFLYTSFCFSQNSVYPLKKGNSWTYLEETTSSAGVDIDGLAIDTITNYIIGEQTTNGETWFITQEFGSPFLLKNGPKGQYELDSTALEEGSSVAVLFFKLPIKGESQAYYPYEDSRVTVSGKTYSINSPAGTFSCYKYTITPYLDTYYSIIYYICIDKGVIKYQYFDETSSTTATLLSYTLK